MFQLTEYMYGVIRVSGAAVGIKLHVEERSRVCRDLFSLPKYLLTTRTSTATSRY